MRFPRKNRFGRATWTKEREDAFCDLIADGVSISEAGRRVGVTEKAAERRFQRIRQSYGWQGQ